MDVSNLPHLNAALNALATVMLLIGFAMIRLQRRDLHRLSMLAATAVSAVFLGFYLVYHFNAPIFEFTGVGGVRVFYYAMLISHVVLAIAATPMIVIALLRALRGQFDQHKRIARWTYPIWLYVSVTGVGVYLMLYQYTAAT